MFGKGSKKPPDVPWALQFLTTDYLISGTAQPKQYKFGDETVFGLAAENSSAGAFELLELGPAELEPTGLLVLPRATLPQWVMGKRENLIAVIPNDDPSRQAAQAAFKDYRQPALAAFYVGPYLIQGQYQAPTSEGASLFSEEKGLRPLVDAQVDCLLPGSQLKGWRVPWLLLDGRLLHGFRRL
jgi:hypothetical protein